MYNQTIHSGNDDITAAVAPRINPLSKRASAYELMRQLMKQSNHLTFRGDVYRKHTRGKYTYVKFATPQVYVDKLLKTKHIGPQICEYESAIKGMLKTSDNPLCDEVVFNYDYIEVSWI